MGKSSSEKGIIFDDWRQQSRQRKQSRVAYEARWSESPDFGDWCLRTGNYSRDIFALDMTLRNN